jgi:lipopolysaccharide export system permease protein
LNAPVGAESLSAGPLGRRSLTLDLYVLKSFLPVFFVSLLFFVLVLQLADILLNIVQYIQNDVDGAGILRAALLYMPKCLSWALPIAMLFSVSFTLGSFFAHNELIVVYGSGIQLYSFMLPVFAAAALISLGFMVFDDRVVIPSYSAKKQYTRALLRSGDAPAGGNDITILGQGGRYIWNIRYFDAAGLSMAGLTLIERDTEGRFVSRMNAQSASWTGERWRFSGVRRFYRSGDDILDESLATYEDPRLDETPDSFKGGSRTIEEMPLKDAALHIDFLKRAGLPRASQETEFYRRFSYALTPLLVSLLSASLAGMFRKNILLMSLLVSLIGATVYYVSQMISVLLAKSESISPFAGAFTPFFLFLFAALALFRLRRV